MFLAAIKTVGVLASLFQTVPNNDLKGLEFLLGEWTSKEVTKGPNGDIEFTLAGSNRWAIGGKALLIEESFKIEQNDYHNLVLIRPDPTTKTYRMQWNSNNAVAPMTFTGKYTSASELVFESEAGSRSALRIVYMLGEPGHYKARLERKVGETYDIVTRAEYTRKSKS